jgi:hypothetical protein
MHNRNFSLSFWGLVGASLTLANFTHIILQKGYDYEACFDDINLLSYYDVLSLSCDHGCFHLTLGKSSPEKKGLTMAWN